MAGDERDYNLTQEQKAIKAKYPPLNKKYEYLDHTADVQLHAWGDTLEEAFEQCVMAMFGYMTDTETVEPVDTVEVEAEGHDMLSLLFHFLDEWLYKFSANEFFIPREVKVLSIDRMQFKIRSIGWGEEFSLSKHPQVCRGSSVHLLSIRGKVGRGGVFYIRHRSPQDFQVQTHLSGITGTKDLTSCLFFVNAVLKLLTRAPDASLAVAKLSSWIPFCDADHTGTEVKAITYSAMQICEDEKPEVFVIIDI